MKRKNGQARFHVGDRVRVDFGPRKLTGVVVEDRGPIGMKGRRLFQVAIPMDPFDPMMMELPEEEMEPAPAEVSSIEKSKIVDYLSNGGLVSILYSNLAGGVNQPRVWLRPDHVGNVTHTFVEERGVVGGRLVPARALHEGKVFTPKRDEVISLLESFGLSRQEAEMVLSDVGTSP